MYLGLYKNLKIPVFEDQYVPRFIKKNLRIFVFKHTWLNWSENIFLTDYKTSQFCTILDLVYFVWYSFPWSFIFDDFYWIYWKITGWNSLISKGNGILASLSGKEWYFHSLIQSVKMPQLMQILEDKIR